MSDSSTTPDAQKVIKPSDDEIRPVAEELYRDTNHEPGHDVQNWQCAERMLEQKRRVQIEIEKAASRGYFSQH